jgi:hypothetical protein
LRVEGFLGVAFGVAFDFGCVTSSAASDSQPSSSSSTSASLESSTSQWQRLRERCSAFLMRFDLSGAAVRSVAVLACVLTAG